MKFYLSKKKKDSEQMEGLIERKTRLLCSHCLGVFVYPYHIIAKEQSQMLYSAYCEGGDSLNGTLSSLFLAKPRFLSSTSRSLWLISICYKGLPLCSV